MQEHFLSVMAQSHGAYLRLAAATLGAAEAIPEGASAARPDRRPAAGPSAWPPAAAGAPMTTEMPAVLGAAMEAAPPAGDGSPRAAPPSATSGGPGPGPGDRPGDRASPDAADAVDPEHVAALVTAVIAEATGYPEDMLEDAMELEADLGVDSIRRVEILMTLEERAPGLIDPEAERERIAALRTIGDVAAFLRELASGAGGAAADTGATTPPMIGHPRSAGARRRTARMGRSTEVRRGGMTRPSPGPRGATIRPGSWRHEAARPTGRHPSRTARRGGTPRRPRTPTRRSATRRRSSSTSWPRRRAIPPTCSRWGWSSRPTSASTRSSAWRS